MRRARSRRFAWGSGVVSACVYGMMPTVAAIGYAGGVAPTVLVFLRSLIGGVLLLGLAVALHKVRVPLRDAVTLTVVCGPLFAIQLLCFFAAITLTGAQIAVVVAHMSPLFVLVVNALLTRRPPRPTTWVVCGAMVAGVALVSSAGTRTIALPGLLLGLASAAGYAAYYLVGEPCLRRTSVVTATALTSLGAAATAGTLLLLTPPTWQFTTAGWLSVVVQGVIIVPLGIGGAYLAVRALGPALGSLLGLLEPVVGVLAAAVFLHERLAWPQWIGVALVLLACGALPRIRSATEPRAPTVGTHGESAQRAV